MRRAFVLAALLICTAPTAARANERSRALMGQGFDFAYNLDYPDAVNTFKQAIAADPNDAAAYRALATVYWLHIIHLRGSVSVDEYLGSITKSFVRMKPPPPELSAAFQENATRALKMAETRVAQNPRDADARYQEGTSVALMASYSATIEGKILQGFKHARRAFDTQQKVLALDPKRKDAGLICGIYRYIVSTLSLPFRVMAYAAGFGGGREEGLRLIESAASTPSDAQTDAKFALVLIHNRERRYEKALDILRELQQRYPRNRLLWLEYGATSVRGKRFAEADAALTRGLAMLANDRRPRMFGEIAMWRYKQGAALVGLGRAADSDRVLREGLREADAKEWVRGRIQTELGKVADLNGNRAQAREQYERARQIAAANNDPIGAKDAERWLQEPYARGK